jgi:hypothetical protein
MSDKNTTLTLTKDDLQGLISAAVAAAVAESRKPAPLTTAELAKQKDEQERRQQDGLAARDAMSTRANFQRNICSHIRPNGTTMAVLVKDELGAYFLCQDARCMARIRPGNTEERLRKVDVSDVIYDTAIWNRLMNASNMASF